MIILAFVVGGVQRDTISLGDQEFTLSAPLHLFRKYTEWDI
jgi:hypothetical protein